MLKRMVVFSHKMIFIENEAALLCALLWLVSGPRVVNQTRSDTLPKNNSNDAFISNDVYDVESTMSHDEITIHCNSNSNGITHAIAVAINEESKINNISKVTTLNYLIKDC